jgi:hypothetical protein
MGGRRYGSRVVKKGGTVIAVFLFAVIANLAACGSASVSPGTQDRKVRATQWRVIAIPDPYSVTISSSVGYCIGDSKPRYASIHVTSRNSKAFITPFVEDQQSQSEICDGIGSYQRRTLRLDRRIDNVALYDAAVSPPALRWPKPSKRQVAHEHERAPVHWRVASVAGATSVRIFSNAGYCLGDPKPRYGAVQIVKRPDGVFISPSLIHAPSERGSCRGVGYSVSQTIDLDRELSAVKLYDSTTSPRGLRWPRSPPGLR